MPIKIIDKIIPAIANTSPTKVASIN